MEKAYLGTRPLLMGSRGGGGATTSFEPLDPTLSEVSHAFGPASFSFVSGFCHLASQVL